MRSFFLDFVPDFALVMFLLISAWHFGDDFDASSKLERLNAGLLLLTARRLSLREVKWRQFTKCWVPAALAG